MSTTITTKWSSDSHVSPRCRLPALWATITFDVTAQVYHGSQHSWQNWYEVFAVCRRCHRPTIFLVARRDLLTNDPFYKPNGLVDYEAGLNGFFKVDRYISLRDNVSHQPPDHLPDHIADAFKEGAACYSIACYNAAATMFRLCIDLATRPFLPDRADASKPQPN
jgi:Domain of unknown function (DUF4145)